MAEQIQALAQDLIQGTGTEQTLFLETFGGSGTISNTPIANALQVGIIKM